jgi:hypothetical protein
MAVNTMLIIVSFVHRQGMGKCGNEYGPLQEIPDWSYAGSMTISLSNELFIYGFCCVNKLML